MALITNPVLEIVSKQKQRAKAPPHRFDLVPPSWTATAAGEQLLVAGDTSHRVKLYHFPSGCDQGLPWNRMGQSTRGVLCCLGLVFLGFTYI